MNKETLAELMNGREYGSEITDMEERSAKEAGLVAIFGASDDLIELRGAISDEEGAWNGTAVFISGGKLLPEIDDDHVEILERYGVLDVVSDRRKSAVKVEVLWCKEPGWPWFIKTEAHHAAFEIVEGEEKFCRGIVIDLKEIA